MCMTSMTKYSTKTHLKRLDVDFIDKTDNYSVTISHAIASAFQTTDAIVKAIASVVYITDANAKSTASAF